MLISLFAPALLCAAALPQEEIILMDGRILDVQRITGETYSEVTYKTATGTGRKDAEQVRELKHAYGSRLLNTYADGRDLMVDEQYVVAIQAFNEVLEDKRLMTNKRYAWVKGDTLFRQVRCMFTLGDFEGVVKFVDRLLSEVPDTFYYAPALMFKAEALELKGDESGARAAFEQMSADVVAKGLPARWEKESELGLLLLDKTKSGAGLRRTLEDLVALTEKSFPTVASRATAAIGLSFIEEEKYGKAEEFFESITANDGADDRTEASAFFGLGLCNYRRGLEMEDQDSAADTYFEANLNFLRVVTMYRDNVSLVPKSMYYSSLCFNRSGGSANRRKAISIAGRLLKRYPNSQWTAKVKRDLNLR
ncbi:MAG: tetratricopeptide repeat protein [Planctomycetota bacterium]|jgi:tetratricopeptide (TPR) repeat protein|nr:tetratricopeptide repeat protein [Planctomycetota bacterium]